MSRLALNRKTKQKKKSNPVLQRAEKKLQHVASSWTQSLPINASIKSLDNLKWFIEFETDIIEFNGITLSYQIHNKLFATLYDLQCQIDFRSKTKLPDSCLTLEYDARTQYLINKTDDRYNVRLNDLIVDRIKTLGVTHINAMYEPGIHSWHITMNMLVGSSTWNLIPPVMHLIDPSCKEYVQATELLRMLVPTIHSIELNTLE